MFCSLAVYFTAIFILYKILDRLIRIPTVGNYKDRYILVTGCDRGFGNMIAKRLDLLGCHVFAGCFTEKGETDLKKVCSERLHAISLDVTKKESVRKALEYVKTKLPKGRAIFIIYKILDHVIRIPRVGNYKNRYILVTGCDSGFGNLIAKRLDQLGCHVFAGCFTEKGETDLKKVCSERLHAISLDVSRKESVRKALDYVKEKLPQGRGLWGVLNNAGIWTCGGSPDWFTVDDYKKESDVNLWGVIDVTLTFLPLVKKEKGRVVNTTSAAGRMTLPLCLPYSVSKYGVETFTDGIRRTIYYFGCKACLIEPGYYKSEITKVQRVSDCWSKSWEKSAPEIKTEYGEEYSKYVFENDVKPPLQSASDHVTDVVDAYEHALLGRFPRARYLVGNDAKYLFIPIQALPEWLGDWIWRRFESGRPLPEAMKK